MIPAVRSMYVPMHDGTRLAVDVVLPEAAAYGARVGAVVRATRYWRSAVDASDTSAQEGEALLFTGVGLALVRVDVRGTGASFGTWAGPWSPQEIADLAEVVDWVAAQEWCNGRIGAHGVSYDGNTAELIGSLGRESVVAVAPRFADYDPWAHLAVPGGVFLESFLTGWAAGNRALDLDAPELAAGTEEEARELRAWFGHPKPVDGDDGTLVSGAVIEHAGNIDLIDIVGQLEYYDDEFSRLLSYPDAAPFSRRRLTESAGTQTRHVGSWFDAGTAAGVIARFLSTDIPQRAVIGAWSHGGQFDASPFATRPGLSAVPPVEQQRQELAAWLAGMLDPEAEPIRGRTLRFRTVGSEEWRTVDTWPPEGVTERRLWLSGSGALEPASGPAGQVDYRVDPAASTGATTNRWQTQATQAPVHYPDRREADARCAVWTGDPSSAAMTVTGTPVLHLELATTATDGAVHAYLETVSPEGNVVYLTEGILRLLHRATGPAPYVASGPYHPCTRELAEEMVPGQFASVELALFPISARIPAGWRLRLALAGADAGTFRTIALDEPVTWSVAVGSRGSWIDIPVERTS